MNELEKKFLETEQLKDMLKKTPAISGAFAWEQFLKRLRLMKENEAKKILLNDLLEISKGKRQPPHESSLQSTETHQSFRELEAYLLGGMPPDSSLNPIAKNLKEEYFYEEEGEVDQKEVAQKIEQLNKLFHDVGLKISSLNKCFDEYLSEVEKKQIDSKLTSINKKYDNLTNFIDTLHLIRSCSTHGELKKIVRTITKLEKINEDVEMLAKSIKHDFDIAT